jgi:hypothetical protein
MDYQRAENTTFRNGMQVEVRRGTLLPRGRNAFNPDRGWVAGGRKAFRE